MAIDPGVYRELNPFIIPRLFYTADKSDNSETLRFLLSMMKDLHSEGNSDKFTINYLETQIPIKCVDREKANKYRGIFLNWTRDLSIQEKMKDDGCFHSFVDYLKALQIYNISEEFGKNLQTNKVDEAIKLMQTALQRIGKIGHQDRETLKEGEMVTLLNDMFVKKGNNNSLLIGNPLLDAMSGGFETQTLSGFISKSGGGKTQLSHNLIAAAIEQEKHVWVGAVEDRKNSFTLRILSRLTGIPMRRMKQDYWNLTPDEKNAIKKADAKFHRFAKVDFMYGVGVDTVHQAALDHDMSCRLRGKPVSIVNIIDYTGHIASKSAGDKGFEKMRQAYGDRKDFILKHNKIGFDFAQVNREGTKNMKSSHLITQADLAGGFDIVQVFDNMISLNRSDEDILANTSKLHVCKARDAGDGATIQVKVDFSKALYKMNEWELLAGPAEAHELARELKVKG